MEMVAEHGYRAVALDMRGYGRSSGPADPTAYTPLHTVGDLVGVLDALDLAQVTVVGHDFGAAAAAVTYPSFPYHSSGAAVEDERWDPFAGGADMVRPAPVPLPPWADREDVSYAVGEFQRTGFEAPLNYYRSIQPFFDLTRAFRGTTVQQPSYYLTGDVDALHRMRPADERSLRADLPGLRGVSLLPGVGHWPNKEAPDVFNATLLDFLRGQD